MTIRLRPAVLEEHILRNNMTQNGFARKARVSNGYLAQLLAGKRSPSGSVRAKIMAASKLDFDDLFQVVTEEAVRG